MWMRRTIVVASAAVMTLLALPALAADAPKAAPAKPAAAAASAAPAAPAAMPGKLADFWIFWPKAGHEAEFEAAVKAHVGWRKQMREGFFWEAYQPVVGSDLARYVFRSGQHHWADFDAQQVWELANKADEMFNRDVAPLLARYEHYIEEEDYASSHWVEGVDYRYFMVAEHKLKPGMSGAIAEATAKIHKGLQAGGWTQSYALSRSIGGPGGLTLVFPYASYAAMEEPKPGFMEVLTKGMDSPAAAQAAIQQFDDSVAESDTTIYMVRPDLSTPK